MGIKWSDDTNLKFIELFAKNKGKDQRAKLYKERPWNGNTWYYSWTMDIWEFGVAEVKNLGYIFDEHTVLTMLNRKKELEWV